MACLKDLPPELIGLIVEFFFAGVPVDCDEGRFSRHARLGTHLFAILRICKDLVTPQQVQDAMLRNSIIHLDDAEDVENFDRFLQPGQRQLMRTLRLSRHFTHTVGLSVLHDRSDEFFNSLSIIEMESDPDEAMFMVDHRSDIFVRFGEHTEHIKQYKDPTCMCGADHGPMQRIQGENTRTAKHIEQALRRSFFECSSRIAAGLCIYRFLFEESNTEDLRNIVERADQCNVEVRIYLNAAIMVNLGESYCGCEWNLHEARFSSKDNMLRIKLGTDEICIPQRFGEQAPLRWQKRMDDLGDDYCRLAPSWLDHYKHKSELMDGPSADTVKDLEAAWVKFREGDNQEAC